MKVVWAPMRLSAKNLEWNPDFIVNEKQNQTISSIVIFHISLINLFYKIIMN